MVHQPDTPVMKNKGTLTKPYMQTKGVSCRPHPCHKAVQTDGPAQPAIVPLACPMYMPMPMQMYNAPYPVPIPVPLPIPIPVFIPTTRRSIRGIMKHISKIKKKLPADPFEAELLAMAGALKKDGEANSENEEFSDDSGDDGDAYDEEELAADVALAAVPILDFEREIPGGKVVPKPLPLATPDPIVEPGPPGRMMPGQAGMAQGQKRRYSQTRGEQLTYLCMPWIISWSLLFNDEK